MSSFPSMTDRIDRRDFLVESGHLALAALVLSLDARARAFGISPMAELEKQLPLLMKEVAITTASIAFH